jgi:hypothetical protein
MAETLRKRFPPPWKIVEIWDALEIHDSHGIRLLTISRRRTTDDT